MNESVLNNIKTLLQIPADFTAWDETIIMHINSVLFTLKQLGVVSNEGFSIQDQSTIWSDFLGQNDDFHAVKTYIGLKVRKIFDPPTTGPLINSLDAMIAEWEWRLNVEAEPTTEEAIAP